MADRADAFNIIPLPKRFLTDEEIRQWADAEAKRHYDNDQYNINRSFPNIAATPKFETATLDNYVISINPKEREGQQEAIKTARAIVHNCKKYLGVLFRGKTGTGKNHIAAGICKELATRYKTSLVIEAGVIFAMMRDTYSWDAAMSELDIRCKLKKIDVLIIDEIKGETANEKTRDIMERIINDRYNACKLTILMGNADKDDLLKAIGERAISRFKENGKVVKFDWQDWRGRKK